MATPFASALATLHSGPCAEAALYYPGGNGTGQLIRITRSHPDREIGFGDRRVIAGSDLIDIKRVDVPEPKADDVLELESGDRLKLVGEPMSDEGGITWHCGAEVDNAWP